MAVKRRFKVIGFCSNQGKAVTKAIQARVTSGVGDPIRILMEASKEMTRKCTLLALAAAALAGSASADSLAALRADPSTQTWECRAAASVGDYILPDHGSIPVVMTLSGHYGRNAGMIDMEGLPVISTKFGLRGLNLAWTWEKGSSAIYLKTANGVASHYQLLNDGTVVRPESSFNCKQTNAVPRKTGHLDVHAYAGSSNVNSLAALRANPSTQTWECRTATSVEGYILTVDGSRPAIMTLAGHHGRNAGLIDIEGLPVITTKFGLTGLSLAWTWEEGSSVVYLKPATGVASHYQFLNDSTVVGLESRYHCERSDDIPRKTGNSAVHADADASSRQNAPRNLPLTRGEKEAFGLAVGNCWNVGSLSTSARATKVVVAFDMQRNGKPVTDSIRMVEFHDGSEADAGRAFEAARRAIIRCGTKGFQLPVEKYDKWREMTATFSAVGMQLR